MVVRNYTNSAVVAAGGYWYVPITEEDFNRYAPFKSALVTNKDSAVDCTIYNNIIKTNKGEVLSRSQQVEISGPIHYLIVKNEDTTRSIAAGDLVAEVRL